MKKILLIIALMTTVFANGQNSYLLEVGYLFVKASGPQLNMFFLPDSAAMANRLRSPKEYIDAIRETGPGHQIMMQPGDSVFQNAYRKLLKEGMKIRNESQEFCIRGAYVNTLDLYKDDYFHILLLPVRITWGKNEGGFHTGSLGNQPRNPYEIKCFGKIIMKEYMFSFHSIHEVVFL